MVTVNITQNTIRYDKKPIKIVNDNHAFKTALLVILIKYLRGVL